MSLAEKIGIIAIIAVAFFIVEAQMYCMDGRMTIFRELMHETN